MGENQLSGMAISSIFAGIGSFIGATMLNSIGGQGPLYAQLFGICLLTSGLLAAIKLWDDGGLWGIFLMIYGLFLTFASIEMIISIVPWVVIADAVLALGSEIADKLGI